MSVSRELGQPHWAPWLPLGHDALAPRDLACMLEARPACHEPVTVTNHAASMDEAIGGALEKMRSVPAGKSGRIHDCRTGATTIDDHLPEL